MARSFELIFDTGTAYSCSSNKGDFTELGEKMFPRNIKGIEKALRFLDLGFLNILSGVKVHIRLCSGLRHIIFLGYQTICASFNHKEFAHKKDTRVPS